MPHHVLFPPHELSKISAQFDAILLRRPKPYDSNNSPTSPKNLQITSKISKGKFPVYLASSKINKQNYAMKVFPYNDEKPHSYYKNETRFSFLKHPNIISMIQYEDEKDTLHQGESQKVSYILMEHAPFGDFFNFISQNYSQIDEKLARTYFRQLIDGIEYLHNNKTAHLDLKPENLLLDANFSLKIADFDLSYMAGDPKILSRGTRFYRGPELFPMTSSSSSVVFELEDPFAADIYSAGILLFILKSGIYPHAEERAVEGICFADLMYKNNFMFWKKHCELLGKERSFYSRDFKELFNGMVRSNPRERLTLRQIKQSRWYNGPIYNPGELRYKMQEILYANQ